jgi:type IV secretion system protein VirB9
MKLMQLITISIILLLILNKATAITVDPQSYGSEKRIKYWRYQPNAVFKHTGFLHFPSYIQFEAGEIPQSISTGSQKRKIKTKDETGKDVIKYIEDGDQKWLFEIKGEKLFLKPIDENADTIAIVITNKRTYFFELHVGVASSPFDTRIPLGINFQYPQDYQAEGSEGQGETTVIEYAKKKDPKENKELSAPDLTKPQNYNFNYTISGNDNISPIKIFDDGQFTYLEFRDKNATLPAVFGVDSNGYEFLLNFRVIGDYIIIESMSQIMTLRYGSDMVCIFNEAMKSEASIGVKKSLNKK